MQPSASTIRVLADITRTAGPTNALTSGEITLWRSSAAFFDVALAFGSALFDDISTLASLTLEIKATATGAAPDPAAAPLAAQTLAAAALTNTTPALWADGAGQHGQFEFSADELNIPAGRAWLVLTATTFAGRTFTATAGAITIKEDGWNNAGTAPTPDTTAYTKAESDALYGTNAAYAARLAAGNLTLVDLTSGQLLPLILPATGKLNPAFVKALEIADISGLLNEAGLIPLSLLSPITTQVVDGLLGGDGKLAPALLPYLASANPDATTLALRTASGRVRTADPADETDAVNLRTMTSAIAAAIAALDLSGGGGGDDDDPDDPPPPPPPLPPTSDIPVDFSINASNLYALFTDTSVTPTGYTRAPALFHFGDGAANTASISGTTSHTYTVDGTFNVTMSVTFTNTATGVSEVAQITKAIALEITGEETNNLPPVGNLRLAGDIGFSSADLAWDAPEDLETFTTYQLLTAAGIGEPTNAITIPKTSTTTTLAALQPYTTYAARIQTKRNSLKGPKSNKLIFTTGVGEGEYTPPVPTFFETETGYDGFPEVGGDGSTTFGGSTWRFEEESQSITCDGAAVWTSQTTGVWFKTVFFTVVSGVLVVALSDYAGSGLTKVLRFTTAGAATTLIDIPEDRVADFVIGGKVALFSRATLWLIDPANSSTQTIPLGGNYVVRPVKMDGDTLITIIGHDIKTINATGQITTRATLPQSLYDNGGGVPARLARPGGGNTYLIVFNRSLAAFDVSTNAVATATDLDFNTANLITGVDPQGRIHVPTYTALLRLTISGATINAEPLFQIVDAAHVLLRFNGNILALVSAREGNVNGILEALNGKMTSHIDLYDASTGQHAYFRTDEQIYFTGRGSFQDPDNPAIYHLYPLSSQTGAKLTIPTTLPS